MKKERLRSQPREETVPSLGISVAILILCLGFGGWAARRVRQKTAEHRQASARRQQDLMADLAALAAQGPGARSANPTQGDPTAVEEAPSPDPDAPSAPPALPPLASSSGTEDMARFFAGTRHVSPLVQTPVERRVPVEDTDEAPGSDDGISSVALEIAETLRLVAIEVEEIAVGAETPAQKAVLVQRAVTKNLAHLPLAQMMLLAAALPRDSDH